MKNFKHCAISINMLHTGGLCGVLRFTARLHILHEIIAKKFRSKYIYIKLNSGSCAPIARAAIKQPLSGA